MENAPNTPRPLQPRLPIWIGGRGEKRTLRAAARYADGWNGAYIDADEWKRKSQVLDQWCEKERRDPQSILRTINLGFYLGADARGVARQEEIFTQHWGARAQERKGFLRGTPAQAGDMVAAFRDAGALRLNIAFRNGPYDWDALHAFAEDVLPAFGVKRPS